MISHDDVQADISARLDGEPGTIPDDVFEAHLAACPTCTGFFHRAQTLQQALGGPAEHRTDLTDTILEQVEPQWRKATGSRVVSRTVSRLAVIATAVGFVVWAILMLIDTAGLVPAVMGKDQVLPLEADPVLANTLAQGAAVRMATALALFFGAWRPRLLLGLLPLLCGWFMFSFGFGMRDILLGLGTQAQYLQLLFLGFSAGAAGWCWWAHRPRRI
ncbi:zf-HC2 domain-containing protein [Corynebacterium renale]|uniref:zf-HC2 domain-containing protein n=1 Tax=Corynebacterium renale TaxID=1724 RepID=UPI00069E9E03|nr:zf-HC2 domain-containing protein [Corynebacterium renale]